MVGAEDVINAVLKHTRLKFSLDKMWSYSLNKAVEAWQESPEELVARGGSSLVCVLQGKSVALLSQTLHCTIQFILL